MTKTYTSSKHELQLLFKKWLGDNYCDVDDAVPFDKRTPQELAETFMSLHTKLFDNPDYRW
jgi:hypothetical protein